jgi:CheY-like chemotaxis protein
MNTNHQTPPPRNSTRPTGRVLVVDDDAIARLILTRWMEIWDLKSVFCADASSALGPIQSLPFQLAIIDYNLPEMNGLELIRRLRESCAHHGFAAPAFALHTTDFDRREDARREGVDYFLEKPLVSADLLLAIRQSGCRPRVSERESADVNHATQLRVSLRGSGACTTPIR